jgi:DNA modification methylase
MSPSLQSPAAKAKLHRAVEAAYAKAPHRSLTNEQVIHHLLQSGVVSAADLSQNHPIGTSGAKHNITRRALRWHQMTLKRSGLLEQSGTRGEWQLTREGREKLTRPSGSTVLLGVSTDLGVALWGNAQDAFANWDEPVALILTSPPYPIATPRAYGGIKPQDFADFICRLIEPIVRALKPGGHVCLNVSNDVHLPGNAGRSTYLERMVIALEDRLSLTLMDRLVWENASRPPGPLQWACRSRQQLVATYEPVYWFSNDPVLASSDNRRVLLPHTERHLALMAKGGEQRNTSNGDGAHRLRAGASFSQATPGRIPRNVLKFGHRCGRQSLYKAAARELGLPVHGAPMPAALASFLVKFLTDAGELVVDPCGGSLTTADAAETLGRRWATTELFGEYILPAAERFRGRPGFRIHDELAVAMEDRVGSRIR